VHVLRVFPGASTGEDYCGPEASSGPRSRLLSKVSFWPSRDPFETGEADIVIGPDSDDVEAPCPVRSDYTRTAVDCVLHIMGVTPNNLRFERHGDSSPIASQ
jgi:hypothetical protein